MKYPKPSLKMKIFLMIHSPESKYMENMYYLDRFNLLTSNIPCKSEVLELLTWRYMKYLSAYSD